jgi:spermidine/putrescine ABC transporter ATP-binding subunit
LSFWRSGCAAGTANDDGVTFVTEMSAFIEIDKIEKRFGPVTAVNAVDLGIGSGEFFSLLGPSGCGKTTLLRMIGGLEMPSSGQIRIDGADVTGLPSYRRPTNMVFQSYAIFPHLTVGENIAYGLRRRGLDRAGRAAAVREMLELIHLPDFADRKPNQLSGGQLQRVALARALVLRPKVLLLDEPLAALDRKLREQMQVELRALQKEVGITFIFVTHDQDEALALSDRIAVMAEGRVLQCASARQLYDTPHTRAVAEFVGEMNFFDGRVEEVLPDGAVIDLAGFGRQRYFTAAEDLTAGQSLVLALRPERFILAADPADGVPCVVRDSCFLGHRTSYVLELDGGSRPFRFSWANDPAHARAPAEVGDALRLRPDPHGAIVLPL